MNALRWDKVVQVSWSKNLMKTGMARLKKSMFVERVCKGGVTE